MSATTHSLNNTNYSPVVSLVTYKTTRAVEDGVGDDKGQGKSLTEKVLIGVVLASIEMMAILSNLLVCIAIFTDKRLKRRNTNLFYVSLAFTDLLLALAVMTFAIVNDAYGRWVFGDAFCLIWISFDIMCATASILHLCLICIDRYLQIHYPLQYEIAMTRTKIVVMIGIVWATSAFISFVPIQSGWHTPESAASPSAEQQVCILEISFLYAVLSSAISFYIPCIVMVFLYLKIYFLARSHVQNINRQRLTAQGVTQAVSFIESREASHRKAFITLGVLMGAFLVCWLPFFIINLIAAYCSTCITPLMFQTFTWLGYFNSCVNPVIYSALNREFRNAFRRVMHVYTSSVNSQSQQTYTGRD